MNSKLASLLMSGALLLMTVNASATVKEKQARDKANATVAAGLQEAQNCGITKVAIDWAAYDSLDWKKFGKSPADEVVYLNSTLATFGEGLKAVCADADYKAEVSKAKEIQIVPANSASPEKKVAAKLNGSVLVLTIHHLGGTLTTDNWTKGIKEGF